MQCENQENHENDRIPYENYNTIRIIEFQQKIKKIMKNFEPHLRTNKIITNLEFHTRTTQITNVRIPKDNHEN